MARLWLLLLLLLPAHLSLLHLQVVKGLRGGVQDVALKMLLGDTHYHVNSFRQVRLLPSHCAQRGELVEVKTGHACIAQSVWHHVAVCSNLIPSTCTTPQLAHPAMCVIQQPEL